MDRTESLHLHIHLELPESVERLIRHYIKNESRGDLDKVLHAIESLREYTMATDKEVAEILRNAAVKQEKTIAEIQALQVTSTAALAAVAELQAVIAGMADADPELVEAANKVAELAQRADDQIPDVPTPA